MRVEVVDMDAVRFAWDAFVLVLGYLMVFALIVFLLGTSLILLAYSIGEALSHWKRRHERKMWAEVGEILENSGFNDEEGGDWWLVHI